MRALRGSEDSNFRPTHYESNEIDRKLLIR